LVLACAATAVAGIGVWEFSNLVEPRVSVLHDVACSGVLFRSHFLLCLTLPTRALPLFLLFFTGLVLFVARFRKPADVIRCLSTEGFGVLYVVMPIAAMMAILFPPVTSLFFEDGRWWVTYLLFHSEGSGHCCLLHRQAVG